MSTNTKGIKKVANLLDSTSFGMGVSSKEVNLVNSNNLERSESGGGCCCCCCCCCCCSGGTADIEQE